MATEKRLIDANELLKLYDMGEELEKYAGVLSVPIPVIRQNIKDMPTVEAVEVVHGYNTGNARWFECSACGYGFNDIFLLDEREDMMEPNYCAHCGAKMDLEAGHD